MSLNEAGRVVAEFPANYEEVGRYQVETWSIRLSRWMEYDAYKTQREARRIAKAWAKSGIGSRVVDTLGNSEAEGS